MSLVVTNTATVPGAVLSNRLRGLAESGWDARLLVRGARWTRNAALRDGALAERIEITARGDRRRPPRSLLRDPARLARYLRAPGRTGPFDQRLLELRPDLIHYHSGWAAWKGIRLKELLGCRVVVGWREDGEDLGVPDLDLLWQAAEVLVFPNQVVHDRAADLGCPPHKAEVLHAPPSAIDDAPAPQARGDGPLRVLSAGWVTWEQGLEHAVHAVSLLRDRGVECEYRILGAGTHVPAVGFARHQLALHDRVHLLGADGGDRLVDEMRRADVFLCPAVADLPTTTALRTAQALGVPCVLTERPDVPEDAAVAVPRRDPRAIAAALARLAAEPALGERIARAARERFDSPSAIAEDVDRLERIYRRALA